MTKGDVYRNFSPDDYTPHICESNGWQYFWSVQQDIDGLIVLTGGKERFAQKLDSMFTYNPSADDELPIFSTGMIGQYAHGMSLAITSSICSMLWINLGKPRNMQPG